jgi:hypothetical protein
MRLPRWQGRVEYVEDGENIVLRFYPTKIYILTLLAFGSLRKLFRLKESK